jgi:hypothetical protein
MMSLPFPLLPEDMATALRKGDDVTSLPSSSRRYGNCSQEKVMISLPFPLLPEDMATALRKR